MLRVSLRKALRASSSSTTLRAMAWLRDRGALAQTTFPEDGSEPVFRAPPHRTGIIPNRASDSDTRFSTGASDHPACAYAGFDPTAPSLHVGSLAVLNALRALRRSGTHVVLVVGGATGAIGDPSGRGTERQAMNADAVSANGTRIGKQAAALVAECDPCELEGFDAGVPRPLWIDCGSSSSLSSLSPSSPAPSSVEVVNNAWWLGAMDVVSFLTGVGRALRVREMLKRDSVGSRFEADAASGLTLAELMYQALQGTDYYHLARARGCTLQVGGADQWGNIVSGVSLVRRGIAVGNTDDNNNNNNSETPAGQHHSAMVHAATIPLVTDNAGNKIGKSSGNAGSLWLDPEMTSPFALYQALLATDDADAPRYLRALTDIPIDEITGEIEQSHAANPAARIAQRRLARSVVTWVHGGESLSRAERTTAALYTRGGSGSGDGDNGSVGVRSLSSEEIEAVSGVPEAEYPRADIDSGRVSIAAAVADAGVAPSRKEARRLIASGAVSLNGDPVPRTDPSVAIGTGDLLHGRWAIIGVGKRKVAIVRVV